MPTKSSNNEMVPGGAIKERNKKKGWEREQWRRRERQKET
jgi:hypothetical protein